MQVDVLVTHAAKYIFVMGNTSGRVGDDLFACVAGFLPVEDCFHARRVCRASVRVASKYAATDAVVEALFLRAVEEVLPGVVGVVHPVFTPAAVSQVFGSGVRCRVVAWHHLTSPALVTDCLHDFTEWACDASLLPEGAARRLGTLFTCLRLESGRTPRHMVLLSRDTSDTLETTLVLFGESSTDDGDARAE